MQCPKCKLISPETALRCDCGFDFPSGEMRAPLIPPAKVRIPRLRWVLLILTTTIARIVFVAVMDGLGYDPLVRAVPEAAGWAMVAYLPGCLFCLLAERENRFKAATGITIALFLLMIISGIATRFAIQID